MAHDFVLSSACKGFSLAAEPCAVSQLGVRVWHLLDDALAYPVAVLRRPELAHSLAWISCCGSTPMRESGFWSIRWRSCRP
jgi:D-serine dehydratase